MQPQEKQDLANFDAKARHRVAAQVNCNFSQVRSSCKYIVAGAQSCMFCNLALGAYLQVLSCSAGFLQS